MKFDQLASSLIADSQLDKLTNLNLGLEPSSVNLEGAEFRETCYLTFEQLSKGKTRFLPFIMKI